MSDKGEAFPVGVGDHLAGRKGNEEDCRGGKSDVEVSLHAGFESHAHQLPFVPRPLNRTSAHTNTSPFQDLLLAGSGPIARVHHAGDIRMGPLHVGNSSPDHPLPPSASVAKGMEEAKENSRRSEGGEEGASVESRAGESVLDDGVYVEEVGDAE